MLRFKITWRLVSFAVLSLFVVALVGSQLAQELPAKATCTYVWYGPEEGVPHNSFEGWKCIEDFVAFKNCTFDDDTQKILDYYDTGKVIVKEEWAGDPNKEAALKMAYMDTCWSK